MRRPGPAAIGTGCARLSLRGKMRNGCGKRLVTQASWRDALGDQRFEVIQLVARNFGLSAATRVH